jgi:hypothetical protein
MVAQKHITNNNILRRSMMMKGMGAWMLLPLLTLVGEWSGRCYGCLEEERIGLLEIQSLIDPDGFSLRDWVDST